MEEDTVVDFPGITKLDLDPKRVLDRISSDVEFSEVVVLGWLKGEEDDPENGNFFFSSSKADGGAVLWLLELAKLKLMGV